MTTEKPTNLAKEHHGAAAEPSPARQNGRPVGFFQGIGSLALAVAALVLCFSQPLYHLVRFSVTAEFHTYILLVPFISLYLLWLKREHWTRPSELARKWAVLPLIGGTVALAGYWLADRSFVKLSEEDSLALATGAFLLFLLGASCLFLRRESLRAIAFPLGFLFFMVPFPTFLRESVETLLQHGSAAAAYLLFKLSGTPVFSDGLYFQLPGFSMAVAPECSGIQSSLVLFLTSLLAGHLFLRTPWKRVVLVLFVIPLAILRNGFRIFTIGQLCVHLGSEMIHSPIHRRGGPVFFALSLVPFFLLLFLLWKSDRLKEGIQPKPRGV